MADRIEQLKKMHEAEPSDTFAPYALAMEYDKAGRPDDALDWIDRTLRIDPDYAYAYFQKAKFLLSAGRTEPAKQALNEAIAAAGRSGDDKAQRESAEMLKTLG
jgi:tetratricopeptide (TPR) repeat protein